MILSIIIVHYNSWPLIQDCLLSIQQHLFNLDYEIIVVDNNSSDGSEEKIKNHFPEVIFIRNDENLGFAKANNKAIKTAKGKYLFLLNPDTLILDNGINDVIHYMENNPEVGLIGPCIVDKNFNIIHSFSTSKNFKEHCKEMFEDAFYIQHLQMIFKKNHLAPSTSEPFHVGFVNGSAMIIRKNALRKVGLLDERFFFCAEEVDWCFRFNQNRFKIVYHPVLKVLHYGGSGQDINLWSFLQYHKSHMKLFEKYQGIFGKQLMRIIFVAWILSRLFYSMISFLFRLKERKLIKKRLIVYLKALIWHFTLEKINFSMNIK